MSSDYEDVEEQYEPDDELYKTQNEMDSPIGEDD